MYPNVSKQFQTWYVSGFWHRKHDTNLGVKIYSTVLSWTSIDLATACRRSVNLSKSGWMFASRCIIIWIPLESIFIRVRLVRMKTYMLPICTLAASLSRRRITWNMTPEVVNWHCNGFQRDPLVSHTGCQAARFGISGEWQMDWWPGWHWDHNCTWILCNYCSCLLNS